jgi:hypothetical protein
MSHSTIRNLKDAINCKNDCHSLYASNSSDTSNNSNPGNKQHFKDGRNIMTTHNSRNARSSRNESNNRTANTMPSKVQHHANSTIWTPTAQYGCQQHNYERQDLMCFRGNSPKSCQICEKFVKKDVNSEKIPIFCSIDFSNSDSYQTTGSPLWIVR